MKKNLPGIFMLSVVWLFSYFPAFSQSCSQLTHNPFTNFNSTPNPQGPTSLWLHIDTKLANTNLANNGDYLLFTGGAISLTGVSSTPTVSNVPIPDGKIIADNTVSQPVTSFDMISNTWITKVPPGYSTSDIFISGAIINSSTGFQVSAGKSSIVTGFFFSNKPSFKDSWFYGLATYRPEFGYSDIGSPGQVSSVGGGIKAGTPIPEKANLVAGGSGGGGSNFTGSNSSTDNFSTCLQQNNGCNVSGLQVSGAVVNASNNLANGSITVTVSGGTPPYSFSWNTGDQTQNLTGIGPGTYTLTVTDAQGCTATLTETVTELTCTSSLSVSATVLNGDFENSCDGAATINVTGGVAPLTYSWSDGVTTSTNTRDNLCGPPAGSGVPVSYTVVVTDANGCTGSASFLIDVSSVSPRSITPSANSATANRFEDATATTVPRVYPNPSGNLVNLQITAKESSDAVVNVVDMTGRIVRSYKINLQTGTNTNQLQLPVHSQGIYMLQIKTGKDIKVLHIVLK